MEQLSTGGIFLVGYTKKLYISIYTHPPFQKIARKAFLPKLILASQAK